MEHVIFTYYDDWFIIDPTDIKDAGQRNAVFKIDITSAEKKVALYTQDLNQVLNILRNLPKEESGVYKLERYIDGLCVPAEWYYEDVDDEDEDDDDDDDDGDVDKNEWVSEITADDTVEVIVSFNRWLACAHMAMTLDIPISEAVDMALREGINHLPATIGAKQLLPKAKTEV
jgi:hypothetical protein